MSIRKPTLANPKQSGRRSLERARDAAKATVEAYLNQAKSGRESHHTRCLEAIAIERAVIADTLGELAAKDQPLYKNWSQKRSIPSIREADEKLFEASDQLYRRSGDRGVKNFARDLKFSIFGFGQACFL